MTGQQRWEVKRSGAEKTATVSAKDLAIYIQQGAVGPSHRFRLEGSTEWLNLDQAQLLLPVPENASTSQPPSSKAGQSKPQSTQTPRSPKSPSKASDTRRVANSQEVVSPAKRKAAAARQSGATRRKKSPPSSPAAPSKRVTKTRQTASHPVKQAPRERWKETLEHNPGMALQPLPPERQQRRPATVGFDEDDVDMTSMIDMTFLLLVFFMVTSTISPYANLQLPEARAGDAERPEGRVVMILDYPQGANGDDSADPAADSDHRFTGSDFIALKDCLLYLEGEEGTPIPPDALQPALQQAFEENGGGEFILQSNRKMPVGVVREVLKLAKSAGAGETMIGVARPR